jgi:hypothetical protein
MLLSKTAVSENGRHTRGFVHSNGSDRDTWRFTNCTRLEIVRILCRTLRGNSGAHSFAFRGTHVKGKIFEAENIPFFSPFPYRVCLTLSEHPSTKIKSCDELVLAYISKNLLHIFLYTWHGKNARKQYKDSLTCWTLTSRQPNKLWLHEPSWITWDTMLRPF